MTEALETPALETPALETPAIETPAPPEWVGTLPDDLKADPTLVKYQNVEALARGHLETKKLASSKLTVPGAEATPEDWGKVWDAVGRPENPDKYDLKLVELPVDAPEEARTALAETTKPFRELAYKIGLTGAQATALSEYRLEENNAYHAKGAAEIAALKGELGADYAPKLDRGQKAFAQLFGDDAEAVQLLQELDQKVGSARLVKMAMRLGDVMGEHQLIDTDTVEGFGEVADAQGKLTELQGDKTWRQKLNDGDVKVVAQRKRLLELASRQALRRGG